MCLKYWGVNGSPRRRFACEQDCEKYRGGSDAVAIFMLMNGNRDKYKYFD